MSHNYTDHELSLIEMEMTKDMVFSSCLAWKSISYYTVSELLDHLLTTYLRRSKKKGLKHLADLYLKELDRFHAKIKTNDLKAYDVILFVNMGGKLPYQLEDMHHDHIIKYGELLTMREEYQRRLKNERI